MANQLDPDKEKLTYAEWTAVRDELTEEREELSQKEGREISEAEMMRRITIQRLNRRRRARGKPPLELDPASKPADRRAA